LPAWPWPGSAASVHRRAERPIGKVKSALWLATGSHRGNCNEHIRATVPGSGRISGRPIQQRTAAGWVGQAERPVAATARAEGSRSAGSHRALAKARGYRRGQDSGNRRRPGAVCAPVIRLRAALQRPPPPPAGAPPGDQLPGVPGGMASPRGVLAWSLAGELGLGTPSLPVVPSAEEPGPGECLPGEPPVPAEPLSGERLSG
jgi:hypothetical protein